MSASESGPNATPEAPFEEPWQAQLFALTVAMNEAGHFTWSEWAATFGPMVQEAPATAYWHIWSDALIAMLDACRVAQADEIQAIAAQWQAAARATPHGQPIELAAAPLAADRTP